jgi:hypothetical protein
VISPDALWQKYGTLVRIGSPIGPPLCDEESGAMELEFSGAIWIWKGPAPWFFVTIPEAESGVIRDIASMVTYGWGAIPVMVRVGKTEWRTSLFPQGEQYLVPIKASVRKAEKVDDGDVIDIHLSITIDPK